MSNDGTTNGNALNSVIFVLMVVIGALFMLKLVIGVLSGEFSKERERVEKRNAYLAMREDKEVNSGKEEMSVVLSFNFSNSSKLSESIKRVLTLDSRRRSNFEGKS